MTSVPRIRAVTPRQVETWACFLPLTHLVSRPAAPLRLETMARLFPPLNFGNVEANVYRSGFPTELNFGFLQSLGLRTVVILGTTAPSPAKHQQRRGEQQHQNQLQQQLQQSQHQQLQQQQQQRRQHVFDEIGDAGAGTGAGASDTATSSSASLIGVGGGIRGGEGGGGGGEGGGASAATSSSTEGDGSFAALPPAFSAFLEDLSIRAIHVEGGSRVTEDMVITTLHALIDPSNHPVLLTCASGRYLTGAVVGCLRKMQRWALVCIFEEYRRFAGQRLHQQHEQFVEIFDTDLVAVGQKSADFVRGVHGVAGVVGGSEVGGAGGGGGESQEATASKE